MEISHYVWRAGSCRLRHPFGVRLRGRSKRMARATQHAQILRILICAFAIMGFSSLDAQEKLSKRVVDCHPRELKKAEAALENAVRPHIAGFAERYNTRQKTLQRMRLNRQVIFRKWLKMRCACQPKGMSRFERNLCGGLSDRQLPAKEAYCLIQE